MKLRVHPVPPGLRLDPASSKPLHRQVLDLLRGAILQGILPPGSALPSTRTLAAHLGISRNTVLYAYEELGMEGMVTGRTGSGTHVRGERQIPRLPDAREMLRAAHYPWGSIPFDDPEGNRLCLHR